MRLLQHLIYCASHLAKHKYANRLPGSSALNIWLKRILWTHPKRVCMYVCECEKNGTWKDDNGAWVWKSSSRTSGEEIKTSEKRDKRHRRRSKANIFVSCSALYILDVINWHFPFMVEERIFFFLSRKRKMAIGWRTLKLAHSKHLAMTIYDGKYYHSQKGSSTQYSEQFVNIRANPIASKFERENAAFECLNA